MTSISQSEPSAPGQQADASELIKLREENRQLIREFKILQADNPKRLKTQVKRLQEDNRNKQNEIALLKSKLKREQEETAALRQALEELNESIQHLQVLEQPQWESEDKSWAVYLKLDENTPEGQTPEFSIRVLDRQTGGAKTAHMDVDDDGNQKLSWPRMRAITKDVKNAVEQLIEG
ncbi:hypothetical protein ElyMa_000376400 [Elysia marginata]|uniref:Kinetochore protein Spc24 n=1 Tax=Elysia marginata TaxID=1093978 RepID=A0AAV4FG75_9GAST|nr:hypothetical protein ElyMa_000376400 [Elysia marginata]